MSRSEIILISKEEVTIFCNTKSSHVQQAALTTRYQTPISHSYGGFIQLVAHAFNFKPFIINIGIQHDDNYIMRNALKTFG